MRRSRRRQGSGSILADLWVQRQATMVFFSFWDEFSQLEFLCLDLSSS